MNYLYTTLFCTLSCFFLHAQPHWKTVSSGTTTDLLSISFANPKTGYISGKDSLLLKTNDSGRTWQSISHSGMVFSAISSADIVDIQFLNEMMGYAIVSNYNNPQYHGKLYKTQDGGISWAPANDSINIAARKSYFFQEGNGFLIGSAFFAGKVIAGMKNGLWVTYTNFNFGAESFLYGVDFFNEQYGITGGDGGFCYRTLDGGQHWDTIYSGQDSTIYSLLFLDDRTIAATTGDGYQSVLISRDSGLTWEVEDNCMMFVCPTLESIAASISDSLITVGHIQQDLFHRGYINWIENGQWQQQEFGAALHAVASSSGSIAFAVGDSGLIITNRAGGPSGIKPGTATPAQVYIFPNPAPGSNIHLRYDNLKVRSLQLSDIFGRAVRSYPPESNMLDISGLASGCYLLQVSTAQGAVYRKVLVE